MHKDKKSLAKIHPEIAKQWHPTKNGDLLPNDVKSGSHKKVWWKCDKGDDHEWESKIANRVYNQQGCSVCSGRTVVKSNCLNTTDPEIAKQWHPTKNGDLTTNDVTLGSNKKVWWKCDKGDDHEWESKIANRTVNEQGCPFCSGNSVSKTNSLETRLTSQLKKEWHPTKNINITPQNLTYGSNKEVWWKCGKNEMHDYQMSPKSKLRGRGCPFCTGHKVHKTTSLKYKYPTVAKQWHPTKNGELTADNVTVGSNKMVWWKCDKGDDHEWEAAVATIVRGVGCSVCAGYTVVKSNCLNTTDPQIAKQWHPTKNGDLTPHDITRGNQKEVWWKCDKGDDHVWKSTIGNRTIQNQNCPYCTLTPQSKQELTITFELMKLFKNIDPKGLKTRLGGKLRAIDIFIPKLNLCVEFDGAYWHKDKRDIDKIKSEMLFEEGFKLIRVREEPLKKLYDTDVISKKPYNGKQVTNDILSTILSIFELDAKLVSKIKAYQSKDGLQNEKGLEKYIDKILTEKAEKNTQY